MRLLIDQLIHNKTQYANNNALWVDGIYYTYNHLFGQALHLARFLKEVSSMTQRCAIYCNRDIYAYQCILAALFAKKTYLPLNPKYPLHRNIRMLQEGAVELLCIGNEDTENVLKLLTPSPPMMVILFSEALYLCLKKEVPQHQYYFWDNTCCQNDPVGFLNLDSSKDSHAYLMFTSGSTGVPKGITVTHGNLSHYITSMLQLTKPTSDDRFTQLSELTFDLSVHELFVCWASGACLYVVPDGYVLGIADFIWKHQVTYWISVPSMITLLGQVRQLIPEKYQSLRYSLFCGEALFQQQAVIWQDVASNSAIINIYGPTEATVAFTYFMWSKSQWTNQPIVPIGIAFGNNRCIIVDTNNQPCKNGEPGELCLAGPQVVDGYCNNAEQTIERFVSFSWDFPGQKWYKTGDVAVYDPEHGFLFKGRQDDQWQIRGYRVEKLDVENELKRVTNTQAVAVIPILESCGSVTGLIAFVSGVTNVAEVHRRARQEMPSIMVPHAIISLGALPLNANGKVDYQALKIIWSERNQAIVSREVTSNE